MQRYIVYGCNSDTVLHAAATCHMQYVMCVCAVYDEEVVVVQLQNDLAKLEVDVLHTQGHNLRLEQAMKLLNEDINEKMQTIGKYEVRCHDFRAKVCRLVDQHKCCIAQHSTA